MCWAALDAGLRLAREHALEAPLSRWRDTREEIRQAILRAWLRRAAGRVHAGVWQLDTRCERAGDPAHWFPAANRPSRQVDGRADPSAPDQRRAGLSLPNARTGSPVARAPSPCARSGWSRRWRWAANSTRRTSCSSARSATPTTWDCWRRRSTPKPPSSSEISRRDSVTWR